MLQSEHFGRVPVLLFPPSLPPKSMLSSSVEAVAASQRVSRQHHSTLIFGGGRPSKSGKRAKCSLCGRNSREVVFPLADLLYLHRKNCHFRINKIALLPMVEHFSQLFLSLLLPPVIVRVLLEGAEGRKKKYCNASKATRTYISALRTSWKGIICAFES